MALAHGFEEVCKPVMTEAAGIGYQRGIQARTTCSGGGLDAAGGTASGVVKHGESFPDQSRAAYRRGLEMERAGRLDPPGHRLRTSSA